MEVVRPLPVYDVIFSVESHQISPRTRLPRRARIVRTTVRRFWETRIGEGLPLVTMGGAWGIGMADAIRHAKHLRHRPVSQTPGARGGS